MKTSIVIPVMNDRSIYRCLDKLLIYLGNKIKKEREILVVNDVKSSDEFSLELKEFCKSKGIKYFRSKVPGAPANRNLGMKLSKGKNILFMDSDCYPGENWINEMEKSLVNSDMVEGKLSYESKDRPLFDRVIENTSNSLKFLTANFGIRKEVGKVCKFEEKIIVFREDTDFGLTALEKGFKHSFNEKAEAFHKSSRFTIKRFVFERKRYVGDALCFKKHKNNPLIKEQIPTFMRIAFPMELLTIILFFVCIFIKPSILIWIYLFPGTVYCLKKYLIEGRTFKIKDTILVLILLPLTMFVKRIAIWRGAIKFRFFLI
ncbi:MAG: glycosyltransferase family A protein [Candidatus Diapherotrites archaeon]